MEFEFQIRIAESGELEEISTMPECAGVPMAIPFVVLGFLIGNAGSPWFDFEAASAAVWRRLWSGAASRKARNLLMLLKLKDIEKCCFRVCLFDALGGAQGKLCLNILRLYSGQSYRV